MAPAARLLSLCALLAVAVPTAMAPSAAASRNPYWFSWKSPDCSGAGKDIDPVSTYFTGSAAKGGRVETSLVRRLGRLDPRWYSHTNQSQNQWYKHYNGNCLESTISVANGAGDSERMHVRGTQVASPITHTTFLTALTPHYELRACGGHNIAYAGAPTRDGGRVRNGGYVYARIKVQQAYGNGRRRAFPFRFYRRPDSRRRKQCTWSVADGGTVVHIVDGN
jgi:hypothetical protein